MSKVMVFDNPELGKVRTVSIDGEAWFVGKDICGILGNKNHSRTLGRVDDCDKRLIVLETAGGKQPLIAVNESGLYSILFTMQPQRANYQRGLSDAYPLEIQRRLVQLRKFKRWVTAEVLPSIRKNGEYIMGQKERSNEEILADAVLVANKIIEEKSRKIEELAPKAEYYDRLVSASHLTNLRDTAKELNLTQNEFIWLLLEKKLLFRDKSNRLRPYAGRNLEYFEVKEWVSRDGSLTGVQTFVTPKGKRYLLFVMRGGDHGE